MARKLSEPKLFLDGDVSDQWRVGWVEMRGVDGWLPRTDHWPFGITIKPCVDPRTVREEVRATLGHPIATLLDGTVTDSISYEIHEIRLIDYGT